MHGLSFGELRTSCKLLRVQIALRPLSEVLITTIGWPASGRMLQESYLTMDPSVVGTLRLHLGAVKTMLLERLTLAVNLTTERGALLKLL